MSVKIGAFLTTNVLSRVRAVGPQTIISMKHLSKILELYQFSRGYTCKVYFAFSSVIAGHPSLLNLPANKLHKVLYILQPVLLYQYLISLGDNLCCFSQGSVAKPLFTHFPTIKTTMCRQVLHFLEAARLGLDLNLWWCSLYSHAKDFKSLALGPLWSCWKFQCFLKNKLLVITINKVNVCSKTIRNQ